MSNTPTTYLGLISLHRSSKVRVKNYEGDLVTLDPTNVTWISLIDDYNLAQLNHHASVGQFLAIGQWTDGIDCGIVPPVTDLKTHAWWLPLRTLNDTAKVRVKGWQYDSETSTNVYGFHNLKPNVTTYIYIGYVPYDEDGSYARGLADENDWQYNLRQLGHHNSIGQYVVTDGGTAVNIQGLNDTSHVRVYDTYLNTLRTATTNTNAVKTPVITDISTSVIGGSLTGNTTYYYVVTPVVTINETTFESEHSQSVSITTGGTIGSEIQIFRISDEASGTYSFTYDAGGSHEFTTAALAYNATDVQIKTALNNGFNTEFATTDLEYVTTSTEMTADHDVIINFSGGPLAGQNIPELIVNNIDLNAEATVGITTNTEGGDYTDTNTVTLSWTPVYGAVSYKIYRSEDNIFDAWPTTDGFRIVNTTSTTITDDGSSTDNAIPNPYWWMGLVYTDLNNELGRNTFNHHTAIGQYIVWPFNLSNNNND